MFSPILKALDLWMAGCMIFVFAALGEFVVVKVLDVQYQYQINRIPKVLPMVNVWLLFLLSVFLTAKYIVSTVYFYVSLHLLFTHFVLLLAEN